MGAPGARWRRSHEEGAFHAESEHVGRARRHGAGAPRAFRVGLGELSPRRQAARRPERLRGAGRDTRAGELLQTGDGWGPGRGGGAERGGWMSAFPGGSAGRQQAVVTCQPGRHLVLSVGGSAATPDVSSSLDRGQMAANPERDKDARMGTHTRSHVRVHARVHMHTEACAQMHAHRHMHAYTRAHSHRHTCVHTCTHRHTHTHMCAYVHTQTRSHKHARVYILL